MVERDGYDAWGKRRYPTGADDPAGQITSQTTTRGFTGQEELDFGLVHLGRSLPSGLTRGTRWSAA